MNRSSLYLFPLIYDINYLNYSKLNDLDKYGFRLRNLYLYDKSKYKIHSYSLTNRIFILIEVTESENISFIEFMNNVKNHRFYETFYSINDNLLMIVFKINSDASYITDLFKKGQYSKFPEQYKSYFIGNASTKIDSCYNIVTKNAYLKKAIEKSLDTKLDDSAELDDIPYDKDIVFDINNFT